MTTKTRRFVFDTTVLVSAMMYDGSVPSQAVDYARQQGTLIVSLPIIDELNNVFRRKKFDRYLSLEGRLTFLAKFLKETELIEITETIVICRDPKDDKFLEVAVCGKADCIISGDDDLQSMSPFRDIPIHSPQRLFRGYMAERITLRLAM